LSNIIDGKEFSANLRAGLAKKVTVLKDKHGITPGLAVILVGEDPASQVYVRSKGKQTAEAGMNSDVHGILVQLPLPKHIDEFTVINAVAANKDVDGFHLSNVGLLSTGGEGIVPCTPLGSTMLLKDHLGNLSGKKAIVIGRSNIVGKPMLALLLKESCTVTIAHSRTQNLEEECRQADIVVAAVGIPEMVKGDWIKPGATVIDVGINRIEKEDGSTKLVGDVEFSSASQVASGITPVPGGVGPMTIACLLHNAVQQACRINGIDMDELA